MFFPIKPESATEGYLGEKISYHKKIILDFLDKP